MSALSIQDYSEEDLAHLEAQILFNKILLARRKAAETFSAFVYHMMPDEEHPDDPTRSEYRQAGHTRLLCDIVEDIFTGIRKRIAIAIPPQHGKTIHISTFGPAWILGRNPKAKIIVATYNETRAEELGQQFQNVILSERFRKVFPEFELATGSKSKTIMRTTKGGQIYFVSMHGTVTGRSADYFIIDDPIKDADEVESDAFRENMWKRFFSVAYSRGSNRTRIVVLHTRWHSDDLIGRLCDPDHPERNKRFEDIADEWMYLNVSAVIYDQHLADLLGLKLRLPEDRKVIKAFGLKPMVALWAEDKSLETLAQWKIGEPRTFGALAMGQPTPDDGDFFKADHVDPYTYRIADLPPLSTMRIFGASDHAVSEKAKADPSCLGCVAIDADSNVWVLPDLVWEKMQTDRTVETLLDLFKRNKPLLWFMESELISKSFGPFLRKRMDEEKVYTFIDAVRPSKDKRTRARSIQGRMAMGKVKLPVDAPWFQDARKELLAFPYGAHDDFVDFLAHIGMGLLSEIEPDARQGQVANENRHPVGSIPWIVAESKRLQVHKKTKEARRGW